MGAGRPPYCGFQISWRGGFFHYFFDHSSYFFHPSCTLSNKQKTRREHPVLTVLWLSQAIYLPYVVISWKFKGKFFVTLSSRLVSRASMRAFPLLQAASARLCGWVPQGCIEFAMNFYVLLLLQSQQPCVATGGPTTSARQSSTRPSSV